MFCNLLDLPIEMLDCIFRLLDDNSLLQLRRTNLLAKKLAETTVMNYAKFPVVDCLRLTEDEFDYFVEFYSSRLRSNLYLISVMNNLRMQIIIFGVKVIAKLTRIDLLPQLVTILRSTRIEFRLDSSVSKIQQSLVDLSKKVDYLRISGGIDYAFMDSESRRIAVAQLEMMVCDILSNRCFCLELAEGAIVKLNNAEASAIAEKISNIIPHKDIYLTLPTTESKVYINLSSRHLHAVMKREDRYFIKIGNLVKDENAKYLQIQPF